MAVLRSSALMALSQRDADFALACVCAVLEKANRFRPMRFVERLPDAHRDHIERHIQSGYRCTISGTRSVQSAGVNRSGAKA